MTWRRLLWLYLAILLLFALARSSAQELADAPSAVVHRERVLDWKFVTLSVAGKGAIAADYYTTRLDLDAGYRERNPLLGSNPSNTRLVVAGLMVDQALDWSGYWLKRRHNRFWWAPRVVQIAVNTRFAIQNAAASRARYICTDYSTGERTCRPR